MADGNRVHEEYQRALESYVNEIRRRSFDEGMGAAYAVERLDDWSNLPANPYAVNKPTGEEQR